MQSRQLLRFSRQLLGRALRLRCPRCGEGKIFRRLLTYSEHTSCPRCGLQYDPRGESLAFMYVSTAFLTGSRSGPRNHWARGTAKPIFGRYKISGAGTV